MNILVVAGAVASGLIVLRVLGVRNIVHGWKEEDGTGRGLLMLIALPAAILVLGIGAGIGAGCASFIGAHASTEYAVTFRRPLVSLHDQSGVHGEWYVLGAGSLDSEERYVVRYRRADGGTVRLQLRHDVRVYEDADAATVRMDEWTERFTNPHLRHIGIKDWDWYTELHVPPGTVRQIGFETQ